MSSANARRSTTLARIFSGLTVTKHGDDQSPEDIRGQHGLTLLFDSADPLVDIIFVHGLGGGSRKTWDKNNDPQLYWPKEWLSRDPEFKYARVHTFGYHADWVERTESILNINDFANLLLAQIQASSAIRRSSQTALIFVCHSMGGLVVKKAFLLAQHDKSYQSLATRFDSIYFLATPHLGASSAQLLGTLLRATGAGNRPFLSDLQKASPSIQAISDEFRHYADRLHLYSFYEMRATSVLGVGDTFIVTKESAMMLLPNERVSPLQADHRGVCKYDSPSDPNYLLVRNVLVESLDRISETWTRTNDAILKAQKRKLRGYLGITDQLREFHVDFDEPRVEGSCEWLAREQSFRDWRDALTPRLFWLTGNPGTGKSFLANYVVDHLSALGFDCSSFFFRAGDKVHSSLSGCLLSLAWQMAENSVFIRETFLEMHESDNQFDKMNFQSIWRTLFVGGIFQTKHMKPHFWVLDGLDECTDHGDLLPLLAKISSTFSLQIFMTSRPSPVMQGNLGGTGLKVATHEITRDTSARDIKLYVDTHTDSPGMQASAAREDLLSVILDKAEGSFLWVKLVVGELKAAFSIEATQHVLENVPKGMNQIYLRSLDPIEKEELRQPAAKAILMWASTGLRPLNTTELKAALIIHINQTFITLENHISWLCGYLARIDGHGGVRMVHETARSFILNPNNTLAIAFTETEAHEALAIVCLKCLNDKELKAPRGRKSNAGLSSSTRSPLLNYAAISFHEHVENSNSTAEILVDLLYTFCNSSAGNILTWIEYVASAKIGLTVITRAGMVLENFVRRVGKDPMRRSDRLATIETWSTDLIRLVGKFGRNLLSNAGSIYWIIPPLCPRNSMLYRRFGQSHRGISLLGVPSLLDWDDCVATIVYRTKGNRATSVAASSNYFAVGTSGQSVRVYHTSTCQELGVFHHKEAVKVVEFNITSQLVAMAGNQWLSLWDCGTKQLVWDYGLRRPCIAMTFAQENDALIVACHDNYLYYLDIETGQLQETIEWFMDEDHERSITYVPAAAAFSTDNSLLAFVYRGGHIGIWDWENDEFVGLCEKPDARSRRCPFHASSLVFSPVSGANSLAAAYEQGEILVFDPFSGEIKASYKGKTDNQTLACSPDGRTLISGDSVGVTRIFDFQNLDTKNNKMRLLYIISGLEENISALAFCDNKHFVDIRGPKVKVWEPTILVRQALSNNETDSITSEIIDDNPAVHETDPITSLTVHPNGRHIFCATQNGLINVFETTTGKRTQTIYEHARGDTITWMIFGKADDVLASAGISSKVIIRRLEFKGQWFVKDTLFEYRMGERIEQLLFNKAGTRILVVTTTRDMVYSLTDESTASTSWDTRLPGLWCNDPRDPERLLLWVNRRLRVFTWDGLREVSTLSPMSLSFALGVNRGIYNVYSGWLDNFIATVYSEVDRTRSPIQLLFWDAADFDATQSPDRQIRPYSGFQAYGDSIARLVGTIGMVIGLFKTRLLFLDRDGWVCSVILRNSPPETYSRHFFLPSDWLSTDNTMLLAVTARNEFVFCKEDEIAVIKRGMDLCEELPLPLLLRRASTSTSSS